MAGHSQEASGEGLVWAAVADWGTLHSEEERGGRAHRPGQPDCTFYPRRDLWRDIVSAANEASVCPAGETPRWKSRAAEGPSREGEGEAGQACGMAQIKQSTYLLLERCGFTSRSSLHTLMCCQQEEKERKEQEEQRKKHDDDAKKKKALSNMTQQYSAGQKVHSPTRSEKIKY